MRRGLGMVENVRGPTSLEQQLGLEIQALRELVRKQEARIEAVEELARKARLALLDHDVEVVRMLLGQIERV